MKSSDTLKYLIPAVTTGLYEINIGQDILLAHYFQLLFQSNLTFW
jgi:hypothetical protein